MITTAGLVRFWIGTVLVVVGTVVTLGPARTASGEPAPWWVAVGAAAVCLVSCLALYARRVADEPDAMRTDLPAYEPVSVLVGLVLYADVGVVAVHLQQAVAAGQLDGFWAWPSPVIVFVGVALVFSLGDYPP